MHEFKIISERKTRISNLHSQIKDQNLNLVEILFDQSKKFETILSQHAIFLQDARNNSAYLKNLAPSAQTLAGVRLTQTLAALRLSEKNISDYLDKFIFFAVKFKADIANQLIEAEKAAASTEKNRFHITSSLSKFPVRDLHPQKTSVFSYGKGLERIATLLDEQLESLRKLEIFDFPTEQLSRTEFIATVSHLQNDFYNFKNFQELFDFYYNPAEEEKIEDSTIEN